jgi:hypothetical protein
MAMQKLAIGHLHRAEISQAREWVRRARQLAPDDAGVQRLARRCRLAIVAFALMGWWRPVLGALLGRGRRATVAPTPRPSDHLAAQPG